MLFNSVDFLCFLALVAFCYRFMYRRVAARNLFLLLASYAFYGWWDARFLLLLMFSTIVDYGVGLAISTNESQAKRRILLGVSLVSNLGVLAYFKYINFFIDSASHVLNQFGMSASFPTLQIILPVGISFYTFQTLSYTVEIYRRQLKPTKSLLNFALYVAFFPQLVAGPIERAARLLPQLSAPVRYQPSDFSIAFWLILIGYFKKVFVADNIGASIDPIFENPHNYSAFETWLAVLGFSAQIYGDFSGYSDIARGVSRLLGFQLMVNFRLPYFASGPSEFWRRWHISLSTWLRDYVYISFGGNRHGRLRTAANLLLTMLLGGLWHGASMKFLVWGGFHGLLLIAERGWQSAWPNRVAVGRSKILGIAFMFGLTQIGWLLFRASSLTLAWTMFTKHDWLWSNETNRLLIKILFYAGPLVALDTWMHFSGDLLVVLKQSLAVQSLLFVLLLIAIITMGFNGNSEFIYFQF